MSRVPSAPTSAAMCRSCTAAATRRTRESTRGNAWRTSSDIRSRAPSARTTRARRRSRRTWTFRDRVRRARRGISGGAGGWRRLRRTRRETCSPASTRSPAPPSRVCTASTGESTSRDAGTSAPTCASTAATHVARRSVDFPPMFGPVSNIAGGDDRGAADAVRRAEDHVVGNHRRADGVGHAATRGGGGDRARMPQVFRVKHRRAVRTRRREFRATDGSARRRRERR